MDAISVLSSTVTVVLRINSKWRDMKHAVVHTVYILTLCLNMWQICILDRLPHMYMYMYTHFQQFVFNLCPASYVCERIHSLIILLTKRKCIMFVNTCICFKDVSLKHSCTHARTHTHARCSNLLYDMYYYGGNKEYICNTSITTSIV